MRSRTITASLLAGVLAITAGLGAPVLGEVTPDQKKDISQAIKDIGKVSGLIRKKELDEAEEALKAAETRLEEIAKAAGVESEDRAFNGLRTAITRGRKSLDAAKAKAEGRARPQAAQGVSFAEDVAPIIAANCLGCHGDNNPRANLRLDTFAGWRRGGQSGAVAIAGAAEQSLLIGRLLAQDPQQRMPRGRAALSAEDIQTIAAWIQQGASFDGDGEDKPLGELTSQRALASFDYPKPKGTETVLFTRDIAPWFANLCGGCHSAERRSGGLSLASYFDLLKGGDSGPVIIPGDKENSRLFRLVGGLENPRMPQGQGRITRKNYQDLVTWFNEGNTFDGPNVRAPLRSFVRSEEDVAGEKFAGMSEQERTRMRSERTDAHWTKALRGAARETVGGEGLLVVGNVPAERLQEVQGWAEEQVVSLQKAFRTGDESPWKGGLAVFVVSDRPGYNALFQASFNREAPKDVFGHSVVSLFDEDAFVVVEDVGDEATPSSPGLRLNLVDQLTGAFLKRGGAELPEWLVRGAGLAQAAAIAPGNSYLKGLPAKAGPIAKALPQPEALFADNSYSPAVVGPVGFTIVEFLTSAGGANRFVQFIEALRRDTPLADAMQQVYQTSLPDLARRCLEAAPRGR